MKNLDQLDTAKIKCVFFDIDDTLSTEGKITKEAYGALWDMKVAGNMLVPITGRPAGWCDHIARMWPVDAVIGENGAFYQMLKGGRMIKKYTVGKKDISEQRVRLRVIRDEILREVPGTAVASDQAFREFDLAIDFCEDIPRLSDADVDRIVSTFEKHGATTKISSIHVNGWFGSYTKLTTATLFVQNELHMSLDEDNDKFVFVGDSPNDEPMFAFFNNSVGVANVMEFEGRLKAFPKFITKQKSGAGFAALASHLLK